MARYMFVAYFNEDQLELVDRVKAELARQGIDFEPDLEEVKDEEEDEAR